MAPLSVGIFGGTFDPVHRGHLELATWVRQQLALDQMRLLPAHIPPHRASPQVGAQIRAQLVRLALADYPDLSLDARELDADRPSYTLHSLTALRAELGAKARLYFVMGMDSLRTLDRWYAWRQLTDFAHLLVLARPGELVPNEGELGRWIALHACDQVALGTEPAGGVCLMQSPELSVSATQIRAALAAGEDVGDWLTPAVLGFIRRHGLYATT